jgi:hypothetical protein
MSFLENASKIIARALPPESLLFGKVIIKKKFFIFYLIKKLSTFRTKQFN